VSESVDAIVIGATVRGLVTAYVLDALGYTSILVDRRPFAGGADASFTAADGAVFEFGMHVLDYNRSPLATRLFTRAVSGRVCRTRLARAIVLRGEIMPYAPAVADMPASIRELLPREELVDDLGDAPPTRSALGAIYGSGFADLIFDEVLPSFPSEARHLAFGVDESELLANIYPWFFPRAERAGKRDDASRAFHDRLRRGQPQYVLYPESGGFGGFSAGFVDGFDRNRTEVLLGLGDLDIVVDPSTRRIECVGANGRELEARRYFWSDGWPALCALLDLPCQTVATDRIVLGSFGFDAPVRSAYHELLVGDPELRINRLYFPSRFAGRDEPRLQIEFAFPAVDEATRGLDADAWRERWLADLRRLGIIERSHGVGLFDFKSRRLHFNGFGMEGERLIDADPGLIPASSNIFPVAPSMANLNLNAHVPMTVETVTHELAADGAAFD
jgi:hypothetical protein